MPTSTGVVFTMTSGPVTVPYNGPVCGICCVPYVGIHKCSIEALMERAEYLQELARTRFDELCPQPTIGPEEYEARRIKFDPPLRIEVAEDRMAACPCRRENGGSGVCGCINGGPTVTC